MKVTIYGKENCSFCKRAVNLCERKEFDYQYLSLVEEVSNPDKEVTKFDLEIKLDSPVRTVPQILVEIDGKEEHIGGFDEFNAYVRSLR
jgi:glutaredoxin 1